MLDVLRQEDFDVEKEGHDEGCIAVRKCSRCHRVVLRLYDSDDSSPALCSRHYKAKPTAKPANDRRDNKTNHDPYGDFLGGVTF